MYLYVYMYTVHMHRAYRLYVYIHCLNTGLYCRDLTQKLELPTGTHGQTDWFIANTQGGATRYLNILPSMILS